MSGVKCQVVYVMCQVSPVRCPVSPITCVVVVAVGVWLQCGHSGSGGVVAVWL